jgi:hypothetical protein
VDLELLQPGVFFIQSTNEDSCCFNTGLQDKNSADLYAIFARYNDPAPGQITSLGDVHRRYDWVFRGVATRQEVAYRERFGTRTPELAWYSNDSRDYIFNTQYTLDSDIFDHMFERARERSGFGEDASDESVRNYLRGAIQGLLPKIKRNYKTAIPMYYVAEKRMQLLLPFHSANGKDISCFLVERDDVHSCYKVKTIYDMDQAFFAARLITRPDREWLNP